MGRPDTSTERRRALLPRVARTFAELGYRRSTTAALAEACEVPENTLFRLFGGKKGMFLASIELVFQQSQEVWGELLDHGPNGGSGAQRLLAHEAEHLGEHGLYRIVFAGLSETDDAEIRRALQQMYAHFHEFIRQRLQDHAGRDDPELAIRAWAILGLGTVANIGRELELIDPATRRRLFGEVGERLLGPRSTSEPRNSRSPRKKNSSGPRKRTGTTTPKGS